MPSDLSMVRLQACGIPVDVSQLKALYCTLLHHLQIFTRTCDSTRKIALTLRNLGFGAVPIHGQMSQPKRLGALNKFKSGERNILVATDVASRGLDIPSGGWGLEGRGVNHAIGCSMCRA